MLEKPEEKEFHKKWESLYVFTGRRSDLTTMISIAVINPMILYVFIGYVAGKRISLPVLYLIIDGVLFLQWGLLVKRRKRKIDFPVLGKIHVAGMKREEIAECIKNELIKENLVKDPVVTVEFANLCISVLGEVNSPGRFSIDRDRLTILDALSMAGDLTIYGNRSKVMVLRQEGDVQRVYGLNLTSGEHIYSSPAYYLQQNDVVYVEPNEVKARQSTVNGNNVRSTSFWISLASLLTSVAILIFN